MTEHHDRRDLFGPEGDCTPEEAVEAVKAIRRCGEIHSICDQLAALGVPESALTAIREAADRDGA